MPTPNNARASTRAAMNTYKSIKVLREDNVTSPKFGALNNTVSCPDGLASPRENDNRIAASMAKLKTGYQIPVRRI